MIGATPLIWSQLTFPSDLTPEHVQGFLAQLHGLSAPGRQRPVIFELRADHRGISHHVGISSPIAPAMRRWATANVPGLHLAEVDRPQLEGLKAARRLWQSTGRRPLGISTPENVAAALLSAVQTQQQGEVVIVQWVLGPVRRSQAIPAKHPDMLSERWAEAIAGAAIFGPKEVDAEARQAMRQKQGQTGGWRVVGRLAVTAASPSKAHYLLGSALGAIRTAEGPGVRLGFKPTSVRDIATRRVPLLWPLTLSVEELVGLVGWPLSDLHGVTVDRRRAKLLPGTTKHARNGRQLAVNPNTGEPIAVAPQDLTAHMLAIGPTGVGKSTLLLNTIIGDMEAGRSVFVVEPKQDLIAAILSHIPTGREDDVIVLDSSAKCVGFNPLVGESAELVADQILSVIAKLNSDNWGPRLSEILHASLLTLAKSPGMSLSALPLLLTNDGFRRRLVGRINDPLGVSPIWAGFERLSDEARAQATAAVLNKVRPLVGRSQMRGILGQAEPKFALKDALVGRKIVLVDLAKGVIGPDSARLLGTLILNGLWNVCLTRTTIPEAQRHTLCVYVDELQDYVGIPADLGEMLAQARGLGVAFSLACQHADQLPPALLKGAMSNARTKVVWQTDSIDGAMFARGQHVLIGDDFSNLPSREVYVRVAVDAEVTPWMSGKTLPAPSATSDPVAIRAASLERYGVDRRETDLALRALVEGPSADPGPVGTKRRRS